MKNLKFIRSSGFTLIELLVVIAIIGLLSSIVLAALTAARNKGGDSKVQVQMNSLRSAAEIYAGGHGGYMTAGTFTGGGTGDDVACSTGVGGTGTFANAFLSDTASGAQGVISGIATTTGVTAIQCSVSTTGWVVVANLPSNSGANPFWCVDSSSRSKGEPTISSFTGTSCN